MGIKVGKRQQKAEQNKRQIFDCAIYLFRKYGYHRVSVEDIVMASNSSVGTFYHYFKCKEELLVLFLNTFAHRYYDEYEKHSLQTGDGELPVLRRLHRLVLFSLSITQVGGEEFLRIAMAYLLREASGEEAYRYMFDPDRPFARMCKQLIREGQEKGEIRTDKTDEELFGIMSLFSNGMDERWFMSRGAFPTQDYAGVLWEFLEKMLGTDHSSSV